jgi:hypothetical protein
MAEIFVLVLGTAVEVELNAFFVDPDVSDDDAIASLYGHALLVELIDIFVAGGIHVPVGMEGKGGDGQRTHGESLLGLHKADEGLTAQLRNGLLRIPDVGGSELGVMLLDVLRLNGEDLSMERNGRKKG